MASIAQLDPDSAELKKRIERFQSVRDNILAQVRQVIVGQEEVLDQILISLFVGGHCLITGLPGTAKTLMVRTIAQTLGLLTSSRRIPRRATGAGPSCRDRSSATSSWPMKSIARRRRRSRLCSRPCRNFRALCAAITTSYLRLSSCWPRKTPSNWKAPTRCLRHSLIVSCSIPCWII